MPDEKTRADSLRLYLTGADADNGVQTDPNLSLGDFRSSQEETFFTAQISNELANIDVLAISGAHAVGAGVLAATGVDSIAWTPPGGTQGAAVTILNGETKILEGGGAPAQFIRVTRTDANDITGSATYTLAKTYNNAIAFDDVTSAEASAGDTEYRALMLKNEAASAVKNVRIFVQAVGSVQTSGTTQLSASGAGTITLAAGTLNDWPQSGFCRIEDSGGSLREIAYYSSRTTTTLTVPAAGRGQLGTSGQAGAATDLVYAVPGIRIATEAPVANEIQEIANESTAPTGRTWGTAITKATGINIGDLAAGALYGLWIERVVVTGAASQADVETSIAWAFEAS